MGWSDSHLHMFEAGDRRYSTADCDMDRVEDEAPVRLRELAKREGDHFIYTYDLGDGWRHEAVVEKIEEADAAARGAALCLGGERACPPEDCEGIDGYTELLEALKDPAHERHDELLNGSKGSSTPRRSTRRGSTPALKSFGRKSS